MKLIGLLFSTFLLMTNVYAGICCSYYGPGGGTSGEGEVCDDNFSGTLKDCIQTAKQHAEYDYPIKVLQIQYGEGHCEGTGCVDKNDKHLPLAIQLISFTFKQVDDSIRLNWEADEKLVATNIWRAQQDEKGNYFDIVKLNSKVIYSNTFVDKTAQVGIKFFYGLETIDHTGLANLDIGSIISTIRK